MAMTNRRFRKILRELRKIYDAGPEKDYKIIHAAVPLVMLADLERVRKIGRWNLSQTIRNLLEDGIALWLYTELEDEKADKREEREEREQETRP
jgi:hypothetical protein